MRQGLKRMVACARGATAIEYALIAALIALAAASAIQLFANRATGMWNNVATTSTTYL